MSRTWDERYVELVERMMAVAFTNGELKPLKEEFRKLLAEKPAEKKDDTES